MPEHNPAPMVLLDPADAMHRLGMDDDLDFYAELLHEFMEQAPPLIEEVRRATQTGSVLDAAGPLHTLKGMALAISAQRLGNFCTSRERACKQAQIETCELAGLQKELDQLCAQTLQAMQAWLQAPGLDSMSDTP